LKKAKKNEAGSEIDSRCLKCKDVTNHTIIAMDGDKVAKVECNVCEGRHIYRPVKPQTLAAEKRKIARAATIEKARIKKAEADYDKLIASRKTTRAKSYSMDGIFKTGELLDHPIFGLGVITEIEMPNKIEVMFRQESKLLICGRLCK
jgi:hypothetical protein